MSRRRNVVGGCNTLGHLPAGPTADQGPVVSFLVVTLRAAPDLWICLDAIRATTAHAGVEAEIVVVANGRSASSALAAVRDEDVTVVTSAVNRGFAGGLALGRENAHGRYLAIVQDDSILDRGWLDALLSAMQRDTVLGALAGATRTPEGELLRLGWILDRDRIRDLKEQRDPPRDGQAGVQPVELASSNSLLVRSTAWDGTGGPDPSLFPLSHVDLDLCMRLLTAGWSIGIVPATHAQHAAGSSLGGYRRWYAYWRNERWFRRRWAAQLSILPEITPAVGHARPTDVQHVFDEAFRRAASRPHPFAEVRPRPRPPTLVRGRTAAVTSAVRATRFRAGAQVYRALRGLKLAIHPHVGPTLRRVRRRVN